MNVFGEMICPVRHVHERFESIEARRAECEKLHKSKIQIAKSCWCDKCEQNSFTNLELNSF